MRKNYRLDYESLRKDKPTEYDPLKLRQIIEEDALNKINKNVWEKEKKLI